MQLLSAIAHVERMAASRLAELGVDASAWSTTYAMGPYRRTISHLIYDQAGLVTASDAVAFWELAGPKLIADWLYCHAGWMEHYDATVELIRRKGRMEEELLHLTIARICTQAEEWAT